MLFDEIKRNKRNTVIMMVIFGIFVSLLGLLFVGFASDDTSSLVTGMFWWIALVVIYILIKYATSMWLILKMTKAQSITEENDPELYHIVEDMAMVAKLPMPKVYIVDDPSPNAFATGTSYKHAAVSVTTGLREMMDRDELEGVISHEISHIKNYDIRISTIAVALVGVIGVIATALIFFGKVVLFSSDDDRDSRAAGLVFGLGMMLVGFLFNIIAVPLAMLMQAFVSRQRESLADVSGVELTRNPQGLIRAFKKLQVYEGGGHPKRTTSILAKSPAAELCLVTPVGFHHLFDSHPPLEERIQRLEHKI